MVDQTKIKSRSNGRGASASTLTSTRTAAQNVAHLLHDAVSLAELQLRLFLVDCQQLRTKLNAPLVAIGIGVVLALSCVPVALAGLALIFRDLVGLTRLESVWLTFAVALVVGGVSLGCGIWWLRNLSSAFDDSRVEWTQNIERLKEMLSRSAHPTQGMREFEESPAVQSHR